MLCVDVSCPCIKISLLYPFMEAVSNNGDRIPINNLMII